jgi:hypothetical protein
MKTKPIPYASDTLISHILTCEAQFGYSRFEEKPLDWQTPFYFISGRIVHEGCEKILKRYNLLGEYDADKKSNNTSTQTQDQLISSNVPKLWTITR